MTKLLFKASLTADSPKSEILAAVLAGEKVHKVSPAFPVDWSNEEMTQMADHVFSVGESLRNSSEQRPTEIPAVNYQNKPINGGLLHWVNQVRLRHKLKYNPYIDRLGRIRPGGRTNRQLWREVSKILLAEYRYWSEKLKTNRELISSGRGYLVEYPRIGNLPFRDNEVFLGGEWSHFSTFWNSFIEDLKYVLNIRSLR